MPLRAEMPASVMKPIMDAIDSGWPAMVSAITLPIRASGMFAMMIRTSAVELYRL
jgi:hypothetical protein